MKVIRTVEELKSVVGALKAEGKSVGLVPTMGALHDGHVSLMEKARGDNDVVVVSVFVNPTQFNNPDDLRTYPRTEEADCARMRDAGVDIAFIPRSRRYIPSLTTVCLTSARWPKSWKVPCAPVISTAWLRL